MNVYTICLDGAATLVMSDDVFDLEENGYDATSFMEDKLWLGDDLEAFGLLDRDPKMVVRRPTDEEMRHWKASRDNAVKSREADEEDDWLVYLVPVSEPDDPPA